jgi:trigger factor
MDLTQTLSQGLQREFSIQLTADDIETRINDRISTLATEVKMPGFRPGKVPPSVVKSRYGKQVLGEVLQASLDEATRKIIDDNGLRVATNPNLDVSEYEDGGGLKATLKLEVMPEIPTLDLAKLSLDRPSIEVSDAEVDEAVERIADENRPTEPISTPRPAKHGDTLVIDFIGRVDGEAFEGGTAEGHQLSLGSNTFIPGFEDGLIGANAGATLNVPVTFPADYPAEHLAGKESIFEVMVHEIREAGAAKIDDEFAATLGMDNLAALKAAVREQISRQHATAIRSKVKTSLLDALDEAVEDFDIPPTLVAQEYNSICHSMNPHDHKDDDPSHACDDGMSKDDKAEADMLARRRVRLGMVLTDIGRLNNLQVTDEEKNRAIFAEAQRHPGQEQQILDYFQKNPQAAQQLAGPIFEDKVVDYILEIAKVKDHIITVEELYKADDAVKKSPTKKGPAKKGPAKKEATQKSTAKKPAAKKSAAKKSAKSKK